MKFPVYYCCQCKKILETVEDLLFVENNGQKGFCSEVCIENFYLPLVHYFDDQEKKLRNDLDMKDESFQEYIENPQYMENLLQRPTEIYKMNSDLSEEIYSFISFFQDNQKGEFYLIALGLIYDNHPSFIFMATGTTSLEFLKYFRAGEKVENPEEFIHDENSSTLNSLEIEPEVVQAIENKKSTILASLLEERSGLDIPYESFQEYERFFKDTLELPDEVYNSTDDEGDDVYTYIKAHQHKGSTFYYFVICVGLGKSYNVSDEALLPVISFPSLDGDLYNSYKKGKLVAGALKS